MNQVVIDGTVQRARTNTTKSGQQVTNLTIENVRHEDGRNFRCYLDVVVWGGANVSEGDHVKVAGAIVSKKHWKTDSDGKDVWTLEVRADDVTGGQAPADDRPPPPDEPPTNDDVPF